MPLIDGIRRKQPVKQNQVTAVPAARLHNQEPSPQEHSKQHHAPEAAADTPHVTSFGDLHPKRKVITMIGVILAMLLAALDQTIVGTALPRIVRELHGADHITWVVTAYMLASTVTVPIYGKLSDLYGRKWFFFSGIVIFLAGSVLCGLSHSMIQLVAFRALQGIGAGAIMGNAFAIIADLFVPAERAKWQGVLGGVFGLASVIGPALGGFLTDHGSWRWVFYVNVPLGLVALAFIGFLMPKVASAIKDKVIDFWGAGLIASTLVPLLLALSWGGNQYAWDSNVVLGLFGVSVLSLAGFVWAEHKSKEPIMPLSLFKNSIFTSSMIILFLMGAAMFGAIIYIPLFGQLVQGVSATASGTILTPLMIGLIGASVVAGQVIARTGKYRFMAMAGTALLALSLLWLSRLAIGTSHWGLVEQMVALGISLGLTMPVFNIAVQNAFDRDKMGVVTAATQLFRNVGGTVGTAVLGAVFNNALTTHAAGLAGTQYGQGAAAHGIQVTNVNTLEGLLSTQGQSATLSLISQMPQAARGAATLAFQDFILQAKQAFAGATDHLFLVAAVISCGALVVCLFLKEVPLRQAKKPDAATEAGDQLAVELGQTQPQDEPALS